jgi:hypothetical protein
MKRVKFEPFIVPQEKLDELKAVMEDPTLPDMQKDIMMRRLSGTCHVCGSNSHTNSLDFEVCFDH